MKKTLLLYFCLFVLSELAYSQIANPITIEANPVGYLTHPDSIFPHLDTVTFTFTGNNISSSRFDTFWILFYPEGYTAGLRAADSVLYTQGAPPNILRHQYKHRYSSCDTIYHPDIRFRRVPSLPPFNFTQTGDFAWNLQRVPVDTINAGPAWRAAGLSPAANGADHTIAVECNPRTPIRVTYGPDRPEPGDTVCFSINVGGIYLMSGLLLFFPEGVGTTPVAFSLPSFPSPHFRDTTYSYKYVYEGSCDTTYHPDMNIAYLNQIISVGGNPLFPNLSGDYEWSLYNSTGLVGAAANGADHTIRMGGCPTMSPIPTLSEWGLLLLLLSLLIVGVAAYHSTITIDAMGYSS